MFSMMDNGMLSLKLEFGVRTDEIEITLFFTNLAVFKSLVKTICILSLSHQNNTNFSLTMQCGSSL